MYRLMHGRQGRSLYRTKAKPEGGIVNGRTSVRHSSDQQDVALHPYTTLPPLPHRDTAVVISPISSSCQPPSSLLDNTASAIASPNAPPFRWHSWPHGAAAYHSAINTIIISQLSDGYLDIGTYL